MQDRSIIHIEFTSSDPKKSGQFYQDVFGWKMDLDANFNYLQFQAQSGPGGAFPEPQEGFSKPGDVIVYLNGHDIDATLASVVAHGGAVHVPKTEIPGMGWFAVFADPAGVRMGLFTGMGG